jgi:membrane-associated phospholipid phosphatase
MPVWAIASVPFFVYVAGCAVLLPRIEGRARRRALVWCGAGLAIACAGAFFHLPALRLVILPPLALLAAYWSTGALWTGPMPRAERLLVHWDRRLGIERAARAMPRPLVEFLEFSYAAVYPLVPLGLAAHAVVSDAPDADRYWTVILVTDFICFGMLPWIQTRPPRALEIRAPWLSSFRAFNVRLLGETSTGVNTVPSGHAAEALAAALMLSSAPWPVASAMGIMAVGVTAGAVFGRYHFALDAVAGWAVALIVWALLW